MPGIINQDFQFFPNVLSHHDCQELSQYVLDGGLGPDSSSKFFVEREKSIRFLKVVENGIELLNKNYFTQPAKYNDFSGGLKRYFTLIPNHIIKGPMHDLIMHFVDYFSVAVGTTFIIHIQSSILRNRGQNGDMTGQGIHTDGVNDQMLVCVERDNVDGAETVLHSALDGSQPLCKPTILHPGDGVCFRDNKLFHEVTAGTTKCEAARRTVIIFGGPEDGEGELSNNKQGTNVASLKMRQITNMKPRRGA